MQTLSVLLVEDSALFSRALANILGSTETLNVNVCSSKTFLNTIKRIAPDVVAIDAVTWTTSLQALVDAVRKIAEDTPVILLGREDLLGKHFEALQAGAVGFVKQTAAPHVLLRAIRGVATGKVWFERELFRKVFLHSSAQIVLREGLSLSQKEKQIMALVAGGATNKEVGAFLGLSERGIKACLSNLFRKIGVPNRSSLTSYAIVHGINPSSPSPARPV